MTLQGLDIALSICLDADKMALSEIKGFDQRLLNTLPYQDNPVNVYLQQA